MRKTLAPLIVAGIIVMTIACVPSSIEMTNATDEELNTACTALSRVGYDYYQLDPLAVGGRILEVAASIHTDHQGPEKTRKYCEGR